MVITERLSTVQVLHRAVLINHGVVTILAQGLQLEGNLTNAPNGSLEIDDSLGWKGSGYGGSFGLVGPSKFKNEGTVWIQQNGNIEAPYNGSSGAVVDNAGGVIANAGNIAVGTGATFVEGNGKVIGSGTVQAAHGNSLIIAGRMENLASGDIDVAGGTFELDGKSVFINNGTITVTGTGSFEAPEVGAAGSIFDNARGNITNEGSFQAVNGTIVEGAGTEVGAPVHLGGEGALDLQGAGASNFGPWSYQARSAPNRQQGT